MDYAIVMQAEPETYEHTLKRLRAAGFNPVALSDPASGARYYPDINSYAWTRQIVYIAVPREERSEAEVLLGQWRQMDEVEGRKISAAVRKDAFGAVLIAVGLGVLMYTSGRAIDTVIFMSTGVGMVAFLIACIRRKLPEDGGRDIEG